MAKVSKATAKSDNIVVPKKSLFDRVAGYLDANDWRYSSDSEKGYYSMGCRIKEANVRVVIDVFESESWRRMMTFSIYPIFVPENRRAAVLEALNRINHSLVYGNYEMDMADGEIRFRTTVESESDMYASGEVTYARAKELSTMASTKNDGGHYGNRDAAATQAQA